MALPMSSAVPIFQNDNGRIPSRVFELGISSHAGWGSLAPVRLETMSLGRVASARPIEAEHAVRCPTEAASHPAAVAEWVGGEPKAVQIAGQTYSLSYVFLGSVEGPQLAAIDPALPVADSSAPALDTPHSLTFYGEFAPSVRKAYLAWIDGGRTATVAPTAFLLLFLYSLEQAIVRRSDHHLSPAASAELKRLMALHAKDKYFCCCAEELVALCDWLDPANTGPVIPASAQANHRSQMPFDVRVYLGRMLRRSPQLEADPALLFLLQQPGTHLDSKTAQAFDFIFHRWVDGYSHRFAGGLTLRPTRTVTLHYDCLDEHGPVEFLSDIPDPTSIDLPPELEQFFLECCRDLEQLDGLSAEQRAALIRKLKNDRSPWAGGSWTPRSDAAQRIAAQMPGVGPVKLVLGDVLSNLFDNAEPPADRKISAQQRRWLIREFRDLGIGFEPDERYGLPSRLRAESAIVLFREEPWPSDVPSDAFHLAQASLVLSALGTSNFPKLLPLRVADIEQRLPYRHRFSDREYRRLEATFLAMQTVPDPRRFLAIWPRLMTRHRRVRDIDQGFGIAFYGQKGETLERFARAVSLALHGDDRRKQAFLDEVKFQAKLDQVPHEQPVSDAADAMEVQPTVPAPPRSTPRYEERSATRPLAPTSCIDGLPAGEADILVALLERPRSHQELVEIAKARQLRLGGALDRINEWSHQAFGASVTRGHNIVRISNQLFEAVQQRVRQC